MKQKGQWLSQVRTRSKTALASSRPSGSPAGFSTTTDALEPAATELELDVGLVGLQLVADDVAHRLAVDAEELVAGRESRRRSRRAGRDRHHSGGRHDTSLRDAGAAPGDGAVTLDGSARRTRPARRAPRLLRRGRDGDQGPGVDGARLRPARLLLPRDRPQPSRRRPVPELGVVFVDDIDDVPAGAPLMLSAHGSAPEVVAAARERDRFVVNAVCPLVTKVHHEAKVRAGKGYTILYVGHAGHDEAVGTLAVAPESMRLLEHDEDLDRVTATVEDPEKVALLAQTTLALHDWEGLMERARDRFPALWTATRNDLCFATTNRQAALREIAARADAVVVIGSAELVEHDRAREGRAARPAARPSCASTAPTSSTSTALARRARRRRDRRRERAGRPRARGRRATRARGRGRARVRHRRGRVLPSPSRAARARARARRRDPAAPRCRPRRGTGVGAGPSATTATPTRQRCSSARRLAGRAGLARAARRRRPRVRRRRGSGPRRSRPAG